MKHPGPPVQAEPSKRDVAAVTLARAAVTSPMPAPGGRARLARGRLAQSRFPAARSPPLRRPLWPHHPSRAQRSRRASSSGLGGFASNEPVRTSPDGA